jgi:CheY-like chemotaxis protein
MIRSLYPAGEEPALAEMPTRARVSGRPLRVLLIEDDAEAAEALQLFLEMEGHEVALARSGLEGLALALTWHPHVVLADIALPGLDGWEVARRLRRHPVTARSRLIAVTGRGTHADVNRSREAGFHYHLTKPCDPVVLGELVTLPRG